MSVRLRSRAEVPLSPSCHHPFVNLAFRTVTMQCRRTSLAHFAATIALVACASNATRPPAGSSAPISSAPASAPVTVTSENVQPASKKCSRDVATLARGYRDLQGLAVDGDAVWFIAKLAGTDRSSGVLRVPIAGGAAPTIVYRDRPFLTSIAIGGGSVVWTEGLVGDAAVQVAPIAGGAPRALAQGIQAPNSAVIVGADTARLRSSTFASPFVMIVLAACAPPPARAGTY
jgi:hypothetical protein